MEYFRGQFFFFSQGVGEWEEEEEEEEEPGESTLPWAPLLFFRGAVMRVSVMFVAILYAIDHQTIRNKSGAMGVALGIPRMPRRGDGSRP